MSCHTNLAVFLAAWVLAACGGSGGESRPAVTSSPPISAAIRDAYSYQITLANAPSSSSFALSSAPTGMVVSRDGLVEWSPTYSALGQHPVEIVVDVGEGAPALTQSWMLRIHQGIDMGVTLSPRGHTSTSTVDDFEDHYLNNDPSGRLIAFHATWRDDVESAGAVPGLALQAIVQSQAYDFKPAIGIGWRSGSTLDLTSTSEPDNNSWTNAETRAEFVQTAVAIAESKPPYLFLGNETNAFFLEYGQAEWDAWVSVFDEAYAAVKLESPDTVVFTVFQLERLKGVGVHNGWSSGTQWQLLDDFAAVDALGFTSYPYFEYDAPEEIPSDYYDEIATYWDGPTIFTELGWLAAPSFPYPGGEQMQADFIPLFFDLADDLDLTYVTWLFQHDWDGQAGIPAFRNIGFRSNDGGVVRLSEAAWQAEVALRE